MALQPGGHSNNPPQQQAPNVARHTMTQPAKISVEEFIKTNNFIEFIKDARHFCTFMENISTEEPDSFLSKTQTHLQTLYSGGQMLVPVDLKYDEDFDDILTEEELQDISNNLVYILQKNRTYWVVFDPTNENDTEPVCGDLFDDLIAVYRELKNMLLLYDKGTPAAVEAAIWNVKFNFDIHWSNHCIDCIYALHYFIRRGM